MICPHEHVRCNEDIYEELFELLSSMKYLYAKKVLGGNMKPDRFIDIFCDSHHFIDCNSPCCKNAHRMNMGILRNLYTKEKVLLDEFLNKEQFSKKDFSSLLHRYLTARPESQQEEVSPITFGGKFTEKQMACFAGIAYNHRLFLLPEGMNAKTAMTALLQCRPGFTVKVRNIRNMAVFFDELLARNLVTYNWQSTIEKGRFLLSPKSNEPITASTFSSALNKAKVSPTATQVNIRNAIIEMQKEHITDK